jgi:PTS system N-acetylgalactosamine-specific IID component
MASDTQTLPQTGETATLLGEGNDNIYEDQKIGAELTKRDINRVA